MLNNKSILITGGTGSFGQAFAAKILRDYKPRRVIIYSRDEYKQYLMRKRFIEYDQTLRFFIGDVRDKDRLKRAFIDVDIVIHAAALKQVPIAEYNPLEAIKTNIHGAENVIDAALDSPSVEKVIALSTDKAVNPINLYGATKLVSDKLFIAANNYVGKKKLSFSVVRYGNVAGSRGSIIPLFKTLIDKGEKVLPITDLRMTRFHITLDQGIDLVLRALKEAKGGEIYVAKIPSIRITDLAVVMSGHNKFKIIGVREGEKLHEVMITREDSKKTYDYGDHYIIYPSFEWWDTKKIKKGGKKVGDGFCYSSEDNERFLAEDEIASSLKAIEVVL